MDLVNLANPKPEEPTISESHYNLTNINGPTVGYSHTSNNANSQLTAEEEDMKPYTHMILYDDDSFADVEIIEQIDESRLPEFIDPDLDPELILQVKLAMKRLEICNVIKFKSEDNQPKPNDIIWKPNLESIKQHTHLELCRR